MSSGIGFLGAGVIMKEGAQSRGLDTAATLWASAAVCAFAGGGRIGKAVLVAAFVLAGNTLLRPIVDIDDRRPVTAAETEAHYRVQVVCDPEKAAAARDPLFEELEHRHYPIREIETLSESDEVVELAASPVPTSADSDEPNLIVAHLRNSLDGVGATWTVGTDD